MVSGSTTQKPNSAPLTLECVFQFWEKGCETSVTDIVCEVGGRGTD